MTKMHPGMRSNCFANSRFGHWSFFRISCFVLRASAASACFLWLADSAAAAEVRLRSSAVCNTAVVRLADIAEIHGDDALLMTALSEVPLCAAPGKGSERQFTQQDIRQLLALSGVEPAAVQVTGSETVTLLTETIPGNNQVSRRRTKLPTHRQAVFEVELRNGREQIARQPVASPVKPAAATSALPKPQRLVERNALCTVHARTGGIRVTTQGKALQAGAFGETISIEMAETKERVLGRITGSQIVEVAVAGAVTAAPQLEPTTALLPVPPVNAR